jgi:hypothetical protein
LFNIISGTEIRDNPDNYAYLQVLYVKFFLK